MKKALLFTALLALVGCGGAGTVKVVGKVELTDGSPLPAGTVSISDGKNSFRGPIQKDGVFTIEQVVPGDYKVAILDALVGPNGKPGLTGVDENGNYYRNPPNTMTQLVDKKYADPGKSNLTLKVPGDYNLKVDPPSSSKK